MWATVCGKLHQPIPSTSTSREREIYLPQKTSTYVTSGASHSDDNEDANFAPPAKHIRN